MGQNGYRRVEYEMETDMEWEYSMETIVEWEFVIYLRSMTRFHTMVMMMGPLPNITMPVKPTGKKF